MNHLLAADNIKDSVLKIEQLSISSQSAILVDSLSLVLQPYQCITILGETGSGKSLLANAVIGNLAQGLESDGRIELFGKDQSLRTTEEKELLWGRKLGVLPQEPWYALDPTMQAHKQVEEVHELVLGNTNTAKSLTQKAFDGVELKGDSHKFPHQLSGGMAQRVAYLCATQTQAELLIADEPTKGLDSSRRDQIIHQLQQQKQQGALLTITHDIEVAEKLGGEIIVMRKGVIQERGPAEQVINHPQSRYAKELIAADPKNWQQIILNPIGAELINVHDLSVTRGDRVLFQNLSMTLSQGEILGISGDSGSGKSSLADVLLGLLTPTSGNIQYIEKMKPGQILKLYQDPPSALAKGVTLQTLLNDVCQYHQVDTSVIEPLLQRLSLSHTLLKRQVTQVSGGELQRFAILRALLMRPKILVADEPTSRLDPITATKTLKLIIELTQEMNCALVLISHDKAILEKSCHNIIRLEPTW